MNRKLRIKQAVAMLLTLFLLVPIAPVFSLSDSNVTPAFLPNPEIYVYSVEIEGPSKVVIPYFTSDTVTYSATVYRRLMFPIDSPLVPVPGATVTWSAYVAPGECVNPTALGLTRNENEVTIPVTALEGTYGMMAVYNLATDTIKTEVVRRIPMIEFVNDVDDFSLDVPYANNPNVVVNYTARVVDQHNQVITSLTPKIRKLNATSPVVDAYYNDPLDRITLSSASASGGTIEVEAYIEEFDALKNVSAIGTATALPTQPVYSVKKNIVINRDRDYPSYGILTGDERIAIPRNGDVTKIYNYKIFSQYGIELTDVGDVANFSIPDSQPADIDVDSDEQTLTVKVESTAPHSYLYFYVMIMHTQPSDDDGGMKPPVVPELTSWNFTNEMYKRIYLYLDKKVYGARDDANNTVALEQNENIEYRIVNNYPDPKDMDANSLSNSGHPQVFWQTYYGLSNPRFPGKMDVHFRYKNNYEPVPELVSLKGIMAKMVLKVMVRLKKRHSTLQFLIQLLM